MSDEKSLAVVEQRLTPQAWQMIQEVAPAMQGSRLFGLKTPEEGMAIMLKGYELGLSLTASFEFVQVIQGKPTLAPRGALALVQQSPNFAGMKITDEPGRCTVWMKRRNGFEYEISYTIDEAKNAGLIKKDSGWEKYEANMLRWRAVGYCIDVVFPDVIGGMKRSDEMGAEITPEGDVWTVEAKPIEPVIIEKPVLVDDDTGEVLLTSEDVVDTPQYNITELGQLLEVAKDSDITGVFDGAFPTTEDEINLVVHRLVEKELLAVNEDGEVGQLVTEAKENDS